MVRSEMSAATLTWMADLGVPTSASFEEFFRSMVFGELIFDDDEFALLGPEGVPVTLPVGWHLERGHAADREVVQVTLGRPHVAAIRDATRLVMRSDGWSHLRIRSRDLAAGKAEVPQPPEFITVRTATDGDHLEAWFRNEDVKSSALIAFGHACPRLTD